MATSQNGWLVLDSDTTGRLPRLRGWRLPRINRKLLSREGSAGFLLVHLAVWFDDKIERIDTGALDDWGWAPRSIIGSNDISNHASGTAIDLNATQHPMGVRTTTTYSQKQINLIHLRLRFFGGCIRWGGDYNGRPDAMHWEINKGMVDVEKKARELSTSVRGKAILGSNPGAKAIIFS